MTYDETNSLTSHAWTMATRAASNISCIETHLWDIKVKYADDPHRRKVEEANNCIAKAREQLMKALSDLNLINDEMKRYTRL